MKIKHVRNVLNANFTFIHNLRINNLPLIRSKWDLTFYLHIFLLIIFHEFYDCKSFNNLESNFCKF